MFKVKAIWVNVIVLSVFFIVSSFSIFAVIMWGRTGSPGETTCVSCHGSFPLNSGPGNMQIILTPSLVSNQYVPGQTYTVTVKVAQPGDSLFNCDVEVIDSLGNNSGNTTNTSLYTSLYTYIANSRINVFGSGTQLNYFDFSFNWTAPTSGEANIYATGMQSNSDGTNSGDYVYSDSLIHLKPYTGAGIHELNSTLAYQIYPNPATDFIHIRKMEITGTKKVVVKLIDSKGSVILSSSFENEMTIETRDFPKGLYYLKITDNEFISFRKILIQ